MATVRFSKELIEKIVRYARVKMQPPIDKAKDATPDNAWGQTIYDTLFTEAKPIISQVPAGWLKTVEKITIESVAGVSCGMTFGFAPQPWPYRVPETDLASADRWNEAIKLKLKHHLVWGEFRAEVVAYNDRVKAAVERQAAFVDAVKSICNAYTTLAPALKAWPPLWELIPEDVKDKHREIKEREKKEEVVLNVDIGKLTALSTAAKFGL